MNPRLFIKPLRGPLAMTALVCSFFAGASLKAAVEVSSDHIAAGSVVGTIIVINSPSAEIALGSSGPQGPDWTDDSADGYRVLSGSGVDGGYEGTSPWEPDGATTTGQVRIFGNAGSTYTFNLADSGVDLPDGAVINAIYGTWTTRGVSGGRYTFTEGAATGDLTRTHTSGPAADLGINWTDSASTVQTALFEKLFDGPITIEGGNGFEIRVQRSGNTHQSDAILLDVTLPSAGEPTLSATVPDNGATNVGLVDDLVATFSEPIQLTGNGTVTLRNLTLGSDLTINLPDDQISASGTTLTIRPASSLAINTDYAVRISDNAVEDLDNEAFGGILDDTTWAFSTTSDATPPTLSSTDPVNEETNVPPYANLVATFSEEVALTDGGTITIKNLDAGDGSSDIEMTLPDSRVSVSGTEMTIDPATDLDPATRYAVRISNDGVRDLNGNPFGGIADDTTWSFTTAAPPSGGIDVTLDHVVSGTVTGSLVAIDIPYPVTLSTPGPLGPDWPEDSDDGYEILSGSGIDGGYQGASPWEPDGSDAGSQTFRVYGNGGSTYTFDLADGTVINAVYGTWTTRGVSGGNYSYTEGAASDSVSKTHTAGPASDLELSWTDSLGATRTGSFERLFTGPIVVEGGDGFTLKVVRSGNTHQSDAIVLDISGKAIITSFEAAGATGRISQSDKTIGLEVPFGTDLATLAPSFTLSSGTCDQPDGAPPTPTFAAAPGNTVTYTVTDDSTEPPTVNAYDVTVSVGPQIATLVIDLGGSPGTTIAAGADAFIGSGPTNLPLPALPLGSILRSIAVDLTLEATDNTNFTNDLAVLLDPTPADPGGDFSLGIMSPTANVEFGEAATLEWVGGTSETDPLSESKTRDDWSGDIDLSTTGLFLGNAYDSTPGSPGDGGTWAGTITLTYEVGSGASAYSSWSGGEPFEADKNGDGVSNGLAFLLGAADPDEDAVGRLPSVTENAGGLVLSFTCRDAASRGPAVLNVQWSSDLGATDLWSTNLAAVPGPPGGTVNEVVFAVTENATDDTLDDVVATIPASKAAGGKLFGRLEGSEN